MDENDHSAALAAEVRDAFHHARRLRIVGADTKVFLGRTPAGDALAVGPHRGIVAYEPSELVVTARAGTPLVELEAALSEHGQFLPFEPPRFAGPDGGGGTIGGAVASGLGGPRRAYAGAPRDFLLGVRMVNGRGDDLRFGGQVMKNVAGYDVSRLMAGAMGTLGVLLEVSLKVLPRPRAERTLSWGVDLAEALERMAGWARTAVPISATLHDGERLFVRLSGSEAGVEAAHAALGAAVIEDEAPWEALRDQRLAFFAEREPLWRLALPEGVPPLELEGRWVVEWGGTERWLRTAAPAGAVRAAAACHGGHAAVFRGGDRSGEVFHPLAPGLARVHRRLKEAFDPAAILNPGRLYPAL